MSQKHSRILHAILQGPAGGNIHWRDIESLLRHLGADIQAGHGARMRIILNGVEGTLHRPHHSSTYSKLDIHHLRDYLISAGVDKSALKNE